MHDKIGAVVNHSSQASFYENFRSPRPFSLRKFSSSAYFLPKPFRDGRCQTAKALRIIKCLSKTTDSKREIRKESCPSLEGAFEDERLWDCGSKTDDLDQASLQYWGCGKRSQQLSSFRVQAIQAQSFTSARPRRLTDQEQVQPRRTHVNCVPQFRDTPPKRDTGIASEKDWGINLKNEISNESDINEDGSTWYRESGEDLGENGYRCRWTVMGGRNADGSSDWKEAWWEKSDWTGYKELGAEKSGKNAQGDSWWETWQEVLRQDEWSNLARIEKSAQKQAKSGTGSAGWYEKWWEKYNAKGWTEKGAHKYGRLNDQSWWEKWGEQYDGQGSVLKWTDKWAETDIGTKWGDKWEDRFFQGMGTRQGETWHSSSDGERWSRTWGEEHFGNGKVHKYGKSTSGEIWDAEVEEGTYYEAEPHYGWADAIGNSTQLLSIEPLVKPPGVYPEIDFSSAPSPQQVPPQQLPPPSPPPPPPPQPPSPE